MTVETHINKILYTLRKSTKAVTGVYPFKKYIFVPKQCILVPQEYILVHQRYLLVPKWYTGSVPVTAFVPSFLTAYNIAFSNTATGKYQFLNGIVER